MTIRNSIYAVVATGLLGAYGTANAVSITAVPDATVVLPGSTVTVQFIGNFDDDPTIGGSFDILYDAGLTLLDYSQEALGDPDLFIDATLLPGNIQGSGFGLFIGIGGDGDFLISTATFLVNGPGLYNIAMQDNSSLGGPFYSEVTFQQQVVNYGGTSIQAIPIPAAAWLMIGGLGALFGFGRRKA